MSALRRRRVVDPDAGVDTANAVDEQDRGRMRHVAAGGDRCPLVRGCFDVGLDARDGGG